jgi:signal transduction histidine kinase
VLQALDAAAPVGLALFDGATRTVQWTNRTYLRFLDEPYRSRGVVGLRLEEYAPNARVVPALMARVVDSGEPQAVEDLEYRGLARGVTWWRLALHPVERGEGRPRDVVLSLVDVTAHVEARHRAEAVAEQGAQALDRDGLLEALRREQGRLALIQEVTAALSSAPGVADVAAAVFEKGLEAFGARAGMLALERQGVLRVDHLFGYRREQAEAFRAVDPGAPIPMAQAFRTGEPVWIQSRGELADRFPALAGKLAPEHGAWAALPLVGTDGCIGVLGLSFSGERRWDAGERALAVSLAQKCGQALERARLFESERQARAEAERATAVRERLMAVVGHDLRTPLAVIDLAAKTLLRRGQLAERERATVARIESSATRMTGIIRDLLDYGLSRQGGGIPVRRAPLRAGELCRRVVDEARGAFPEVPIELEAEQDVGLLGDADRLHQALSNLVGNAVQHGGGGRVDVAVRLHGEEVALSVHNDGLPLEPEALPHLFEPFRRGRGARTADGAGLGLYIVREIVTAHGGTVEVASAPQSGTTFTVRLPRAPHPG